MSAAVQNAAEAAVMAVRLVDLVANSAQSRGKGVLSRLLSLGYGLFEKASAEPGMIPIWTLLTSEKPEDRARGTALIDEHEPTIVKLANSLGGRFGQLQPIGVMTVKDGYDVIYGMRRAIASAYLAAKSGQTDTTIEAKVFEKKMSAVELKFMALAENDDRENESPIDKALTFRWLQKDGKQEVPAIAKKLGVSDQLVYSYIRLLDPKIEDKQEAVHSGEMSIDAALKLLKARKGGTTPSRGPAGGKNADRARMPGTKAIVKIFEAKKKPKKLDQKEWELWITEDVRKLLALRLGLTYSAFKGEVKADPKAAKVASAKAGAKPSPNGKTAKVLVIKRKLAEDLLVSLGKTNARTWSDDTIASKLESIPNLVEEGQKAEKPILQKLLDRLVAGYKDGTRVKISAA